MARLNAVRGVTVTIHRRSDDMVYDEIRPWLQEGDSSIIDDEGEIPTYKRCCYIQADGKDEFYVKVTFTNDFKYSEYSVRIWTYTDGKYGDAVIGNTNQINRKNGLKKKSLGWRKGCGSIRHFCFTHLKMTDNPDEAELDLPDAGTIEVKLWRVISEKGGGAAGSRDRLPETIDGKLVHSTDDMKEGRVTLGVGGGTLGKGKSLRFPKITHIDGRDRPFAVFKFLFREVYALDEMGLPRARMTISPQCPLPAPRPAQTTSSQELEVYIAQLKAEVSRLQAQVDSAPTTPGSASSESLFLNDTDSDNSLQLSEKFRNAHLQNSRCRVCSGNADGPGDLCVEHWNNGSGSGSGSGNIASPSA